jgi:poly(A) polymerase
MAASDPSAPPAWPPALRELVARLPLGTEAYLVGGAVRDLLLGRPLVDLDLAVPRGAVALARRLADGLGAGFVTLDADRGVGRMVWERDGRRLEVDVADFRAADLESDLRARDVTVNAMALPLDRERAGTEIVDPCGGRDDLARRIIRLLSPAVLVDDPLRTLRAVRLAAQLGFALDDESATWIAGAAPTLAGVAAERVREELWKALVTPDPAGTLGRLDALGLLAVVVPEASAAHALLQSPPHREDVWQHTVSVVAQGRRLIELVARLESGEPLAGDDDPLVAAALRPSAAMLAERLARPLAADHAARGHLLLAAFFHDLGKARTRSVDDDGRIHFYGHEAVGAELAAERMVALRFAQAEVQHVAGIVRHHMRPLQLLQGDRLSDRTLHRFYRATGEVAPAVCLLSLADNLAKGEGRARGAWPDFVARVGELIHAFFFRRDEVVAPEPPLGGGELVSALGAEPGPWVGDLLRELAEAKAAGEVTNREQALELARRWLAGRAGTSSEETAR